MSGGYPTFKQGSTRIFEVQQFCVCGFNWFRIYQSWYIPVSLLFTSDLGYTRVGIYQFPYCSLVIWDIPDLAYTSCSAVYIDWDIPRLGYTRFCQELYALFFGSVLLLTPSVLLHKRLWGLFGRPLNFVRLLSRTDLRSGKAPWKTGFFTPTNSWHSSRGCANRNKIVRALDHCSVDSRRQAACFVNRYWGWSRVKVRTANSTFWVG